MQLQYSGVIPVAADDAWATLSDLNRVAACIPGVRLDPPGAEDGAGDGVAGMVTVPLGPLRLTYRGEATFVERDGDARRVVIDATGRDSHGEQAASARITAQLRAEDEASTHVSAVADVSVRGMSAPVGFAVAEFGKGLLRQFVTGLGSVSEPGPVPRPETRPKPEPAPDVARPTAATPTAQASTAQATAVPDEARVADAAAPVHVEAASWRADEGAPVIAYAPLAGTFAIGVLVGWLLARRGRR